MKQHVLGCLSFPSFLTSQYSISILGQIIIFCWDSHFNPFNLLTQPEMQASEQDLEISSIKENQSEIQEKKQIPLSSGLRRRPV